MDKRKRSVFRSFAMITQIGISMMVPIFLCGAIGWWLNRLLNTQICFLLMLFLGIGAAFRNVYIMTKAFYMSDMQKEHDRLKYMQDLKNYSSEHPDVDMGDVLEGKKKRYRDNDGQTRS